MDEIYDQDNIVDQELEKVLNAPKAEQQREIVATAHGGMSSHMHLPLPQHEASFQDIQLHQGSQLAETGHVQVTQESLDDLLLLGQRMREAQAMQRAHDSLSSLPNLQLDYTQVLSQLTQPQSGPSGMVSAQLAAAARTTPQQQQPTPTAPGFDGNSEQALQLFFDEARKLQQQLSVSSPVSPVSPSPSASGFMPFGESLSGMPNLPLQMAANSLIQDQHMAQDLALSLSNLLRLNPQPQFDANLAAAALQSRIGLLAQQQQQLTPQIPTGGGQFPLQGLDSSSNIDLSVLANLTGPQLAALIQGQQLYSPPTLQAPSTAAPAVGLDLDESLPDSPNELSTLLHRHSTPSILHQEHVDLQELGRLRRTQSNVEGEKAHGSTRTSKKFSLQIPREGASAASGRIKKQPYPYVGKITPAQIAAAVAAQQQHAPVQQQAAFSPSGLAAAVLSHGRAQSLQDELLRVPAMAAFRGRSYSQGDVDMWGGRPIQPSHLSLETTAPGTASSSESEGTASPISSRSNTPSILDQVLSDVTASATSGPAGAAASSGDASSSSGRTSRKTRQSRSQLSRSSSTVSTSSALASSSSSGSGSSSSTSSASSTGRRMVEQTKKSKRTIPTVYDDFMRRFKMQQYHLQEWVDETCAVERKKK